MLTIFSYIRSEHDFQCLQEDILRIEQWTNQRYLTLNSNKCKYMLLTRKKRPLMCPQIFLTTYIRPDLEYAAELWDPYLSKDISCLEKIQKFASKICCKSWSVDYHSMLEFLSIPTLQKRREELKLRALHRFLNGQSFLPHGKVHYVDSIYNTRHPAQLFVPHTRTNAYHFSFFPSTLRYWNFLPKLE